ncbi:hypothetical protein LQ318_11970 [Aliifodinibius salicampi]|uniref:MgtE intracellular N domain-containing protein n=1 Tax=Fodinibius salicampi TaxID=1920655 RepID=A0ABT3Q0H0_9BACT|nr:hypothetical protein [Fodinibius salicampi]MCW9713618.1 hypothetical protein [Fodinibius salicampi]
MNIKKLLKIIGFIIGPLIPLAIVIYFLFPYINEEKYEQVAESNQNLGIAAENIDVAPVGADFETLKKQAAKFYEDNQEMKKVLDSLRTVNDSLENELVIKIEEIEKLTAAPAEGEGSEEAETLANASDENNEEFKENIKSFLSLDDENLAPIINEMSDEQLVRLYRGGSSLQRRKLLRSLESKRAAKLMTEVM